MQRWANPVLVLVGVVMVASMFFNWIDLGFGFQSEATGFSIAWNLDHWLFIVPAAGAWLAVAAAMRSPQTRIAAFAAGLAVAGDVAYAFGKGMVHMSLASWLVIGGAAVVLLGVPTPRRVLRVVGGAAMIAGYILADDSHTTSLSISGNLILIEGIVAVLAGFSARPNVRWVALAAGGAVFAMLLLLLGFGAYLLFGIGAWAAFGASLAAFLVALVGGEKKIAKA